MCLTALHAIMEGYFLINHLIKGPTEFFPEDF